MSRLVATIFAAVVAAAPQPAGPDPSVVSDLKVGQEATLHDWYLTETGIVRLCKDFRDVKDLRKFSGNNDTSSILKRVDEGRIAVAFSGARVKVGPFVAPEDTPFPDESGLYRVELLEGKDRGWRGLVDAADVRPSPKLPAPAATRPAAKASKGEADPVPARGKAIRELDRRIYREVSKINATLRDKGKDDEWAKAIADVSARYNIDGATGRKIMAVGRRDGWPAE